MFTFVTPPNKVYFCWEYKLKAFFDEHTYLHELILFFFPSYSLFSQAVFPIQWLQTCRPLNRKHQSQRNRERSTVPTVMTHILPPAPGNRLKTILKVLFWKERYRLTRFRGFFTLGANTNKFSSLFLKASAGVKNVLWKKIGVPFFSGWYLLTLKCLKIKSASRN